MRKDLKYTVRQLQKICKRSLSTEMDDIVIDAILLHKQVKLLEDKVQELEYRIWMAEMIPNSDWGTP